MVKIEVQRYGKKIETHSYEGADIDFIRGILHDIVSRRVQVQEKNSADIGDEVENIIIHCYTQ
jgi:hypothetical protein